MTTTTLPSRAGARDGAGRRLSARGRKLALTAHVGASVSLLGAAAGMTVLSTAALVTGDAALRRAAYLFMHLFDLMLLVPLGVLAMVTGVVLGVGTRWGLLRHRWVATKLALTSACLMTAGAVTNVALVAVRARVESGTDAGPLGALLAVNAVAFAVVFGTATALSVNKPWGRTRRGGAAVVGAR